MVKKREYPEHEIQKEIVQELRRDGFFVFAIPNGGARGMLEAMRLTAEGVIKGVPDMFVALPGRRGAFLEVKAPKGRLSSHQRAVIAELLSLGYPVGVARSAAEAREFVRSIDRKPLTEPPVLWDNGPRATPTGPK